ncbi:hypothetical protein [Odoribacter lunatus]|uniref:hypothetical protein n=1 Tax=Odoribacter lunatus TaxID=2941335 RepID=UPI00203F38F7|nr:hypothetical protein [Odoribacter lunatus]
MITVYLKERMKHALYFRHKRGFGVHSPFMFDFILNVIRDRRHRFVYPEEAEKCVGMGRRSRKFYRLLYRIAVCWKVHRVVSYMQDDRWIRLYLQGVTGEEGMKCNVRDCGEGVDMVYVAKDAWKFLEGKEYELLEGLGKGRQCVVISDIYRNAFNASLWQRLARKAQVRMDMMRFGILLFDEKLQQGSYHLMV